jgi:hypothetical protein
MLFQPAGSSSARLLAAWWRLRFPVCGGNTMVSDLLVRTIEPRPPAAAPAAHPESGAALPSPPLLSHCAER